MKRSIDVVIVNWNSDQQLEKALLSIAENNSGLVDSVIVVDNGSTDDSIARIEGGREFPFRLVIERNAENRGFGAACNQGARKGVGEFILFLNPDAHLYADSLSVSLSHMVDPANREVGIVGIQLLDENGRVSRSCARFPSLWSFFIQALGLNHFPVLRSSSMHMADWDHSETKKVDHVIGAFYLMRRSLFENLSGFDERFFVYLEDLDLSLRAKQAGYDSLYLADAKAFHAGGGTSRKVKAHRTFYSLRSRLFYGFKHFGCKRGWILAAITLLLEPCTRTLSALCRGRFDDAKNTWAAYSMLFGDLKIILKEARVS